METLSAVRHYINALNAEQYRVQLKNRVTDKALNLCYSPQQLLKAVGYLRKQNADGFDIYCRPQGYEFVLLDDLTRDSLSDVAQFQPCVLLETSPHNFQVWLRLTDRPPNREAAKAICRELADQFGADLGSADPDHVGRLPGYTNRKEKHRQPTGFYPYVRLHRAENRTSTFHPSGGAGAFTNETPRPASTVGKQPTRTLSEQDFGRACWLFRQGKSHDYIIDYLRQNSPDLLKRKGSRYVETYLKRTVDNAYKSVTTNR